MGASKWRSAIAELEFRPTTWIRSDFKRHGCDGGGGANGADHDGARRNDQGWEHRSGGQRSRNWNFAPRLGSDRILNGMDAMAAVERTERIMTVRAATTKDGSIEVAVSDRGTGISPHDLDQIGF